MDYEASKENMSIEESTPVEPSKRAPKPASAGNPLSEPAEPRASIETLCSLDISQNIPRIIFPMDAEDSPWGGLCLKSHILYDFRLTVSRCSLAVKLECQPCQSSCRGRHNQSSQNNHRSPRPPHIDPQLVDTHGLRGRLEHRPHDWKP